MINCLLPTYGVLTKDQIQKINENGYIIKYRKGQIIYSQNHPLSHIIFLKSGFVKLYKECFPDKSIIIGFALPNKFLNLMSVCTSDVLMNSASAMEDSETVLINKDILVEIINLNGRYAMNLMKQISTNAFLLVDILMSISCKQIAGRLSDLLLFFANEIYHNITFDLPLSRQEIGEFIGATKETVSRTLTEFKNDRLIEIDDKGITLKSVDLIERLSRMG